ncbi:MAG: TonB C-terminal domain-containing protein [Acidobacteriaceae bacterium]|nr:TonB C-terminal domain-containing protein [Acidobacteriaceae bacterium]
MTAVEEHASAEIPAPELNLLLEWPSERPHWTRVIAASLAVHATLFFLATKLPSFTARREPKREAALRAIPLYVPRDILTQKAPNRNKVSKQIDLADLLAPQSQARPATAQPNVKRFELPKQATAKPNRVTPQILPEAPRVAINQSALPSAGVPTGITAPPPPAPAEQPFQNVGSEAPVNPRPKLAPPNNPVQAAVNGLAQEGNARRMVVTDDNSTEPIPAAPGSIGRTGAQHAAVELESDPQGADFKPYLTRILAIVRANWRRVIPESARMGTLRGRTVLEFIIDRDGSIPKLVTADPSGSEPLDRAAVAGLSMSNPLPPLPSDFKGAQIRLAFSFSYNMPSQ